MKAIVTGLAPMLHCALLVCLFWPVHAQQGIKRKTEADYPALAKKSKSFIQVQKIFFNQLPEDTVLDKRLELGSLTFYFTDKPVIHVMPYEKNTAGEVVLFMPHVEIKDSSLKKIVNGIQHASNILFHVKIEEAQYPVKGIRLVLTFDPAKIAYTYDTFDAITSQPGIVVTFYNRTLMQNISHKAVDKGLLRVAFCEKKKSVVIDSGHGGMDKGAAPFQGVEEKKITLSVGLKVADLLKKKGITVFLTRSHDVTRALDARADSALKNQPSLFVSLHTNASLKEVSQGIETFHLVPALLTLERSSLTQQEQDVCKELFAARCRLSTKCAQTIHNATVNAALYKNSAVVDRGVKQSLASVLLMARVPAILIEMGFVSNRKEAQLLVSRTYQEQLAKGIADGIEQALERL